MGDSDPRLRFGLLLKPPLMTNQEPLLRRTLPLDQSAAILPTIRCSGIEMSLIDLHDVTHHYGSVCALQGVTLSLQPGAIGLIGQNGAGKSTLLKILLGLIRPSQGRGAVLG